MKLASWNVNSLNIRLPRLLDWLAANAPDVVCLQETKLEDAKFPVAPLPTQATRRASPGRNRTTASRCSCATASTRATSRTASTASSTSRSASSRRRSLACASSASTCRTARPSARTNIATSSTGVAALAAHLRADARPVIRRWRSPAISTSRPTTATCTTPRYGTGRSTARSPSARPFANSSPAASPTASACSSSRRRRSAGGTTGSSPSRRITACASTTCCCRRRSRNGARRAASTATRAKA